MKRLRKYGFAAVVIGLMTSVTFNSCDKKVNEIGDPASKLEGINGAWSIAEVIQIDEASPLKDELDLSRFFVIPNEPALSITFNSTDLTYSVVPGTGKNPFGSGGDWAFDDPNYPSYINLYTTEGDTIEMGLGRTIRPTDTDLYLNKQKMCDDSPVLTYQYVFDRN